MKVESILIVGAGSSGWMSAAFLKRTFPEKKITVIETPDYQTVGVGESTLADITNFRDYLGINEKDFVRQTNASLKMSIKFTDFYDKNSGSFHYPFRNADLSDPLLTQEAWMQLKALYPNTPVQDFARCFFPSAALYENNKFMDNDGRLGNFNRKTDVAYHFDATKYGNWLRDSYCLPAGVIRVVGTVADVELNDDGIDRLILSNGSEVSADLYVDCTGFSGLLISKYLKEPFISFSDLLPNNRAWAVQVPYIDREKELEPFTNCTAINNGWCWNIPLWSRLGTGYVYSDKFISPEDAAEEYKQYLMSDKMVIPRTKKQVEQLSFKDIKMRVGIHNRTFVKNVVAIGLSAGFIEPLESNGLFTVQWFLNDLAKVLLRTTVTQWDRDVYNKSTFLTYKRFADFVALHYALSIRSDTDYWKNISKKSFSTSLLSKEEVLGDDFSKISFYKMSHNTQMPTTGATYITIGMNYPIYDYIDHFVGNHGFSNKEKIDKIKNGFEARKKYWAEATADAPSLYQYLKDNYYQDSE
jgi:tryptophan halogenase